MPVMPKRLRMKMLIAMNARAGFGTRIRDANTSYPFRSMRCRISK